MSRPWMPLYVADYLADTMHLNAAQSGAYLHLIMHYWQHRSLPDDDMKLSRIARMRIEDWRRNRVTIEGFFEPGWRHARIDSELQRAEEISSKRKDAAKQKHGKSKPSAPAFAEQMDTQSPSPSQMNSEAKASDASASVSRETLFDEQIENQKPVYADSKHELWGEGVPILVSLGVPNKQARSIIGRWMKETRDDAVSVLGAIQRARDNRVLAPIEWITRALQSERNDERLSQSRTATTARPKSVAQDAILAGMAAALSERPDSRLGGGDARRWREGEAGHSDDSPEPVAIPLRAIGN